MENGQDFREEIIVNIIVKLPVKSIIRFQSVCKSWFDLIKSTRFINKHLIEGKSFLATCFILRRTEQVERRFLTIRLYDETSLPRFHESVRDNQNQDCDYALQMPNFELPELSPKSCYSLKLVGHCNGILCLTMVRKTILLVNPSFNEVKKLPIPPVENASKLIGFGFDNMTMNFKVVRISRLDRNEVGRAEVYDLRSNTWRKVKKKSRIVVDYAIQRSTFFNGVVHWCVGTQGFGWRMLTFNMATELFQLIEFPQGWCDNESGKCSPSLFVLNQDSLAFVTYHFPAFPSHCVNVWILNKHLNEEPWTQMYSIGPLTQSIIPISFSKKHKFLYKTMSGKLILYDLLNHWSSVVCNDISRLWYESHCSDPWMEMEMGVCRPSLLSINM